MGGNEHSLHLLGVVNNQENPGVQAGNPEMIPCNTLLNSPILSQRCKEGRIEGRYIHIMIKLCNLVSSVLYIY